MPSYPTCIIMWLFLENFALNIEPLLSMKGKRVKRGEGSGGDKEEEKLGWW